MEDVIKNIGSNDSLIVTAPPGWGKTYKILEAIKKSNRKAVFIFPLRALCDEVYLTATKKKMRACNLRGDTDRKLIEISTLELILTTPECLNQSILNLISEEFIFIFDEAHLIYYWGETFRNKLLDCFEDVLASSPPCLFLTATLSLEIKSKLHENLSLNYTNIYHLNFGNQKLKNTPHKIYYYPKYFKSWLKDDFLFESSSGIKLIFCKYRKQVTTLSRELKSRGFSVLSCVGGQASEFTLKLQSTKKIDFIVATSVVSHGVNLPHLKKLYFLYHVENVDFYLQMIGRGGRDGETFELHTQNSDYFTQIILFKALIRVFVKRISNKKNSFLYWLNEG